MPGGEVHMSEASEISSVCSVFSVAAGLASVIPDAPTETHTASFSGCVLDLSLVSSGLSL